MYFDGKSLFLLKIHKMKLIFWLVIGFLGYRFWYLPRQLKEANEEEIPQEPDSGEFTDYEEIDDNEQFLNE